MAVPFLARYLASPSASTIPMESGDSAAPAPVVVEGNPGTEADDAPPLAILKRPGGAGIEVCDCALSDNGRCAACTAVSSYLSTVSFFFFFLYK